MGSPEQKYSLYPGRFQPFHEGHAALIGILLNEGKKVCVALRDTPIDEKNPYTIEERTTMIRVWYPDEEDVKIITIPDIEELAYGRDVGYGIRKVRLTPELESISATQIRAGITEQRVDGEPAYIVTMISRSGSSMMMEALSKGGLEAVHNPEQDAKEAWGRFEFPYRVDESFYEKYKGKLAKIHVSLLNRLPDGNYKIVFLRRDPEEILASMQKLTPGVRWADMKPMSIYGYENYCRMQIIALRARGFRVLELNYDDIVNNPLEAFQKIQRHGFPIDPEKAAEVVDPAQRDFDVKA